MKTLKYSLYILFITASIIFISCQGSGYVPHLYENYSNYPNKVKPNDFLIWNTSRFENTAKVIPGNINNNCNTGKIIICTGENRPGEIVTKNLCNADGTVDTLTLGTFVPYPIDNNTESIATDNQIIRLADGSFLAMKNGYTWEEINPHPEWWNSFNFLGSDKQPGQRNCIFLWRTIDCGISWVRQGKIDAALVLSGKYGWPQPIDDNDDNIQDKDANGNLKFTIGGFDRTEIYQDPWTGIIYISGHGDGGPYTSPSQYVSNHNEVIFYSTDNGKTWDNAAEINTGGPMVMTSTPNGRFYSFSCSGGIPMLYYSLPGIPASINTGFQVYYIDENESGNLVSYADVDRDSHILRDIQQPSISRVSLDASSSDVRIAYNSINSSKRQVYRIITVKIDNNVQPGSPIVSSETTIEADDPDNFSCVFGSFIDPVFNEIPSGYQTNVSLFYWIETSTGGDPVKICAKYVLFHNDKSSCTPPQFLSLSNSAPRYWNDSTKIGDYMSGGFFWANDSLNYFAQWVDAAGIHGNIVTVPK